MAGTAVVGQTASALLVDRAGIGPGAVEREPRCKDAPVSAVVLDGKATRDELFAADPP